MDMPDPQQPPPPATPAAQPERTMMTDTERMTDDRQAQEIADAFKPPAEIRVGLKEGDTVYLPNGSEAQFVAAIADGNVIRPLVAEDDDDEPSPGDPVIVREVFRTPPRLRFDAEIDQKRAELADLNRALHEAKEAVEKARTDRAAAEAEIGSAAALRGLADFLAGRISHYAISRYGRVEIMPFEEAMKTSFVDPGQRLLSLFGGSDGDLSWRLNEYRDGSGTSFHAVPCHSESEAKEAAQAMFDKRLAGGVASESLIASAQVLGLDVPQHVINDVAKRKADALRERIARLEADLDKATDELAAL